MTDQTDDELNKAIAKACKWKHLRNTLWSKNGKLWRNCPDYLRDNAMHDAEETLSKQERITFLMWLSQPEPSAMPLDPNYAEEQWLLVHTTASQRAQAFVRTIAARAEREAKL